MNDNQNVIEAKGLTKSFGGRVVVNNLDMRVAQGEIFGFLGPNGSGKTTFIRMLCGLLKPDSGQGRCLGFDIRTEADSIKRNCGYMAQRFSLYADLTVRENLDFTARIYGVKDRKRAVAECIDRMELGPFVNRLAGNLSGGWKQRLALACCILHRPKLLLLDEPTAGVDPSARRDFWDRVHALAADGVTALISTHYMDEAERCHRLAYIAYGDLLAQGGSDDLIRQSGLTTWRVTGQDLHDLAERLRKTPGVDQAAAFGEALHVSGRDPAKLEQALADLKDGPYGLKPVETSLEEVFINLMQGVEKR